MTLSRSNHAVAWQQSWWYITCRSHDPVALPISVTHKVLFLHSSDFTRWSKADCLWSYPTSRELWSIDQRVQLLSPCASRTWHSKGIDTLYGHPILASPFLALLLLSLFFFFLCSSSFSFSSSSLLIISMITTFTLLLFFLLLPIFTAHH